MDKPIELTDRQIEVYIWELEGLLAALCNAIVAAARIEAVVPQGGPPQAMLDALASMAEDVDRRLIAVHTALHGDSTEDNEQARSAAAEADLGPTELLRREPHDDGGEL